MGRVATSCRQIPVSGGHMVTVVLRSRIFGGYRSLEESFGEDGCLYVLGCVDADACVLI